MLAHTIIEAGQVSQPPLRRRVCLATKTASMMAPVSPECLGICLPRTAVALWYRTDFRHRPVHLDFVILGYVMLLVLRTIKKVF